MAEHSEISEFVFDAASEAEITKILKKYPPGKQASAVLPLLDLAQRQMGRATGSAWVPRVAMDVVAERLGMAPIRVYEVATFYTMFNLKPVGRYHLQVCRTTPCWLRGADELTKTCERKLGIGLKGRTADGKFSLIEVECLGACVNAPVVQINDDFYEDLDAKKLEALLEALARGEKPKMGSQIGRQGSAPEGGPQVLLGGAGE
jgi:NADH-quinone oxidoreductase subunit E